MRVVSTEGFRSGLLAFRPGRLASIAGAVILSLIAIACAEDAELDMLEASVEETQDPILEGLQNSGDWELAPNRAVVADDTDSDIPFTLSAEEYAAITESAQQDPTWYAVDGTRYDAMFVLPDGTAYGRKGPAPTMPVPSAENNFGAFAGVDGSSSDTEHDGAAEGAVYTDVSQDGRTRRTNIYPFFPLQTFPTQTNGAMSPDGNTMSGGCSGTKIGPRSVLTASHCLFRQNGTFITTGFFNPGQTNTSTPNGSHQRVGLYVRDWRINRNLDYGIFFVVDSLQFNNLGQLGVEWWPDAASYDGMTAKNRGYPCGPNNSNGVISVQRCADSARADLRCDGWMYGMDIAQTSSAFWTNDLLAYHNDVSFGHSGSAIYNQNNNILGIMTHQEPCSGGCQWYDPAHGPRFRQSMWDDVCSWIADPNFQSAYGQHALCHP